MWTFQINGKDSTLVFTEGSWEEIRESAKEKDQFIMVTVTTKWCYWCRAMKETTFKDSAIVATLNENYLNWSLDAEEIEGIAFSSKFRIISFPTLLFFSPEGDLIEKQTGYIRDNQEFVQLLNEIVSKRKGDYPEFAFQVDSMDPGFPDFYVRSFLPGKEIDPIENEEVVNFLEDREELTDEVSWSVMFRFNQYQEPFGDYFLNNYSKFKNNFEDTDVESHLRNLFSYRIDAFAESKNEEAMLNLVNTLPEYISEDLEALTIRFKVAYYLRTGEWNSLLSLLENYLDNSEDPNLNSINSVCLNISDRTGDPEILQRLADLIKSVTELDYSYYHLDTHAALLFRAGNTEEGIKVAKEAIRIGEKDNIDVRDTELLMEIHGKN